MNVYQPPRSEILPYFHRLTDTYRDYCLNVSRRGMALAIETCAYAWWLCDIKQARAVCDLGSGFSSHVLRLYADVADYDVVVHSVDSSPEWLEKSRAFCTEQGQSDEGFHTGIEWCKLDQRYDVVINDYDSGAIRDRYAEHGIKRLNAAGAMVFDDAHHPDHHDFMGAVCQKHGLALLDLYHQTRDDVHRFARVGVRP